LKKLEIGEGCVNNLKIKVILTILWKLILWFLEPFVDAIKYSSGSYIHVNIRWHFLTLYPVWWLKSTSRDSEPLARWTKFHSGHLEACTTRHCTLEKNRSSLLSIDPSANLSFNSKHENGLFLTRFFIYLTHVIRKN